MTLNQAEKVVIITENIIADAICNIVENCGATGYTLVAAGGKGSRNIRSTADKASVVEDFTNVKIEVIVNSKRMAEEMINQVSDQFFTHYSGIAYLENIEILRPQKF